MIESIYVDNFRCFTDFTWEPDGLELLLGNNGSGKSTMFDVLDALRDFVSNGTVTASAFPADTLTAWSRRAQQTFELSVTGQRGRFGYRLVIEHDDAQLRNRIRHESVYCNESLLYEYADGEARLSKDDGTAGAAFPFDSSRSAISTIPERADTTLLTSFKRQLEHVYVFAPDPLRMLSQSDKEVMRPDRSLHQLASWLRHLSQEQLDVIHSLVSSLKNSIQGLSSLRLEKIAERTRVLKIEFQPMTDGAGGPFSLPFEQLSEGQRMLVALFAIVHAAVHRDSTICIDEPDNYVALREIQPWLTFLRDQVQEEECQCFVISHNPEVINFLAPRYGTWFYREDGGAARTRRFDWDAERAVSAAEIVAQGWE